MHIFSSYGPAGEEVILATLQHHIFLPSSDAQNVLVETMTDVLRAEDSSDAFWKGFQPASFSLQDFIFYIAASHVANLLISDDHQISESEAEVIRLESAEYGRHLHEANDAVDDLVMKIAAPKRVCALSIP